VLVAPEDLVALEQDHAATGDPDEGEMQAMEPVDRP
jgi:hypothetical protein